MEFGVIEKIFMVKNFYLEFDRLIVTLCFESMSFELLLLPAPNHKFAPSHIITQSPLPCLLASSNSSNSTARW